MKNKLSSGFTIPENNTWVKIVDKNIKGVGAF